eukprot:scaffold102517_cov89-Attheya_sp.AAC.1
MRSMFYYSAFNQDLSAWDVSSVTTMLHSDVLGCICIQPRPQCMGCFQCHRHFADVRGCNRNTGKNV